MYRQLFSLRSYRSIAQPPPLTDVYIEKVDLAAYDRLLDLEQVLS